MLALTTGGVCLLVVFVVSCEVIEALLPGLQSILHTLLTIYPIDIWPQYVTIAEVAALHVPHK